MFFRGLLKIRSRCFLQTAAHEIQNDLSQKTLCFVPAKLPPEKRYDAGFLNCFLKNARLLGQKTAFIKRYGSGPQNCLILAY
jgi:hypothetical protein